MLRSCSTEKDQQLQYEKKVQTKDPATLHKVSMPHVVTRAAVDISSISIKSIFLVYGTG